jgi:PIN domain nuclease of toxin-antitoxin system
VKVLVDTHCWLWALAQPGRLRLGDRHHGDPFDRLLIAQAQMENLPIMTADDQFLQYEIEVIWAARRKPRRASRGLRRATPLSPG